MRLILIRIKGSTVLRINPSSQNLATFRVKPKVPTRSQAPAQNVNLPNLRLLGQDTVHFGSGTAITFSPRPPALTYQPKTAIGTYGLPPSHMYHAAFQPNPDTWNPPGVAKVVNVKSLDPTTKDPTQAYASELIVDLRNTKLYGQTMPGEHLSFLDISDPKKFTPEFMRAIKKQGCDYQFTEQDFENLGTARLKNFTIASAAGGERQAISKGKRFVRQLAQKATNECSPPLLHFLQQLKNQVMPKAPVDRAETITDAFGELTGHVRLIVRRVEYKDKQGGLIKGPMTNYLVSRKPGDPLVFAAPISHHFLGPTAPTPAIFFGVGSSVSPYSSMLQTRFEQEKAPYGDTYLAIGHTKQALEYDRALFEKYARNPNNHFTYRPVFSRESAKSGGIAYVQNLIQNKAEARKIFALVLNPQAQIYISGFQDFDKQLKEALIKSTHVNPELGVTEAQLVAALHKAEAEKRLHVEGEVRQDFAEGLQGY